MKKFYQFSSFFAVFASFMLFILKIITFVDAAISYYDCDNISKAAYSVIMQESMVSGIVILIIGLSLGSIISLLIKLNEKKENNEE